MGSSGSKKNELTHEQVKAAALALKQRQAKDCAAFCDDETRARSEFYSLEQSTRASTITTEASKGMVLCEFHIRKNLGVEEGCLWISAIEGSSRAVQEIAFLEELRKAQFVGWEHMHLFTEEDNTRKSLWADLRVTLQPVLDRMRKERERVDKWDQQRKEGEAKAEKERIEQEEKLAREKERKAQKANKKQSLYAQTTTKQVSKKKNRLLSMLDVISAVHGMIGGPASTHEQTANGNGGPEIQVVVRILPSYSASTQGVVLNGDLPNSLRCFVSSEGGRKVESHTMQFNDVLGGDTLQTDVFTRCKVKDYVEAAMAGYATTILCYGQTGSGKTYTMTGPPESLGPPKPHEHGIVQRALHHIFLHNPAELRLSVYMSYYEVYQDKVNDLIVVDDPSHYNLPVKWDGINDCFKVDRLVKLKCESLEDAVTILEIGLKNRKRAQHLLNQDSSRSHSICTVSFETDQTCGCLNLVDLAGSERLKESGAQAHEAKSINRSLFTLGKVIAMLARNKKKQLNTEESSSSAQFIPYRDSVLTKLLMQSLGGNCRTLMIATVHADALYANESLNTLKYAARMSEVSSEVGSAQIVRMEKSEMELMQEEVAVLRTENNRIRAAVVRDTWKPPSSTSPMAHSSVNSKQIETQLSKIAKVREENDTIRAENMRLRRQLDLLSVLTSSPQRDRQVPQQQQSVVQEDSVTLCCRVQPCGRVVPSDPSPNVFVEYGTSTTTTATGVGALRYSPPPQRGCLPPMMNQTQHADPLKLTTGNNNNTSLLVQQHITHPNEKDDCAHTLIQKLRAENEILVDRVMRLQ
eukprot:PhF_6_TR23282/c0_g1_i4/m.32795